MKLFLNEEIHCHTNYSHGKNTIEECVKKAISLNMNKIIISEHGNRHFYARKLKLKDYREMKEEILRLRKKYPNIEILMGLESNILNFKGDIDVNEELLYLLDILYVGLHSGIVAKGIKSFYQIQVLSILNTKLGLKFLDKYCMEKNADALINAIDKYPIKMITHPTSRFKVDLLRVARKCEEAEVALEINSSRRKLNATELILLEENNINIKYFVGTDSHSVEEMGVWDYALKEILESNISFEKIKNIKSI